jgi:hypothetical protein
MLFGVILLVAMYLLPAPFRSQIVLFGVLCISVSIATYLIRPYGQRPRYWRGNSIQLPASNWQEQLYRLIYRQG